MLLLNQLNQVVVIATGYNSCDYIYDSSSAPNHSSEDARLPALYSNLLQKLEEFMIRDEKLGKEEPRGKIASSLLSGSLSMALCCILHESQFCVYWYKVYSRYYWLFEGFITLSIWVWMWEKSSHFKQIGRIYGEDKHQELIKVLALASKGRYSWF